ncbi:MAG: chemotaxis protein CheB [Candidatus Sphingomonas colombiensis]|nr:chemotaxis protein CheB [Sphingomonas sp.]WEK44776.1 MAG: chemotaxis protein CheB [Sphingomonas sp.]
MSATRIEAVVIGASAGAVEALSAILPHLPADYPLPVLVVVHVPADRRNSLTPLFQSKCRIAVREADDKEPVVGGTVYFAPPDYHLLVETDRTLSLSADDPVLYSRPSIDVLFESAAEAYGPALAGVVLTGANQDGARGLAAVEEAGGIALVEDPATACSSTMPLAALHGCTAARALSLDAIASRLLDLGGI